MTSTDQSAIARARTLLELRRYDEALQILGPLVAQRPDDPEPLFLVARALSGAGRSREAIASAERACALAPESSYAHRLRAEILLELKRIRPALLAAKRSVELDPLDASSHWALARAAVARHDMKTATRAAERIGELEPGTSLGYRARGYVFLARRKFREAEQEYRHALAMSPDDPLLLNNLGQAVLYQGRSAEATDLFVRAGRIDSTRDLFVRNTAVAARAQLMGGRPTRRGSLPEAAQRALRTQRIRNRQKYRRLPNILAWWFAAAVVMEIVLVVYVNTIGK